MSYHLKFEIHFSMPFSINPFVPNVPFLYLLKTSENLTVFGCFQGVEKGCIGNKWVKLHYPISWPENEGNEGVFLVETFVPDLRLMFSNKRWAEKNTGHKIFKYKPSAEGTYQPINHVIVADTLLFNKMLLTCKRSSH